MHTLVQICHLSLRDYLHERLLSACAVLGLAAVLAPLLILFGVKFGVVETLTERLHSDPATLEISPVGSGHFSAADMDRWRDDGRVAFVMPRTRTLAVTVELLPERGTPLHVSMEPTGHEDPLLARHALPAQGLVHKSACNGHCAVFPFGKANFSQHGPVFFVYNAAFFCDESHIQSPL